MISQKPAITGFLMAGQPYYTTHDIVIHELCRVLLIRQIKILRRPLGQPLSTCPGIVHIDFERSWQRKLLSHLYSHGKAC
jgi:hypothetical protein